MNTYTYQFAATCPSDGDLIIYKLQIERKEMIYVENIKTACGLHDEGYQEEIAADLLDRFGGRVTLEGVHQGVHVKTVLGEA